MAKQQINKGETNENYKRNTSPTNRHTKRF